MKAFLFSGQGAQFRGMGGALFDKFPSITEQASDILGYSIKELCLEDPLNNLGKTQFTQPALYVVNALGYLDWCERHSAQELKYLAGHSLGEYNALLAAEVFSFADGLKLVAKRGELMAGAKEGGMAAVLGIDADEIQSILDREALHDIEIVNFNTPTQSVLSGGAETISDAASLFKQQGIRCAVLNVSGAFHSKYMRQAQHQFSQYLATFDLKSPKIAVISNTEATPYQFNKMHETLGMQIASPVRWMDSIIYMLAHEITEFVEEGSVVLTKMNRQILSDYDEEKSRLKLGLLTPSVAQVMPQKRERYFTPWQ